MSDYDDIECTEDGCTCSGVEPDPIDAYVSDGGDAVCTCHPLTVARRVGVARFSCDKAPDPAVSVAELSLRTIRDLQHDWRHEAAMTVHHVLAGDLDAARSHAREAKRLDRAANEHLWHDSQTTEGDS